MRRNRALLFAAGFLLLSLAVATVAVVTQQGDEVQLTEVERLKWENKALQINHQQQEVNRLLGELTQLEAEFLENHGVTPDEYEFDRQNRRIVRKKPKPEGATP